MKPAYRLTYALLLTACLPLPVFSQDAVPKVNAVVLSANQVIKDLKLLSDLTNKTEQTQWENIEGILETFLFGIDGSKPIGLQVMLGGGEQGRLRMALPITSLKVFRDENLGGFEINSRKVGVNLFKLSDKDETFGYMRFAKPYVTIGEIRSDVNVVVNPRQEMATLLQRKYSLGASVTNTAANQASRRKAFLPVKKNLLAAITPRQGEQPEEFVLRKQILTFEIDDVERFFVESQSVAGGLRIDPIRKQAHFDLDLTALTGSSLDAAIQQLATTPSHFSSIPRSSDAILVGRLHHPLDPFRRAGLQALLASARSALHADIQRNTSATDSQKAASSQLVDVIVSVTSSGLQQGILDSFIDVKPSGNGGNVLVGGIRTVRGERLRAAIAALPQSTLKLNVSLDVETAGDVKIHSVTVPADLHNDFVSLFGESKTIYVGTSSDAAWCAAGPESLTLLKAAISAAAKPKETPDQSFLDLKLKVGPWLKLLDSRLGSKGNVADRKLALDAFQAGGDTIQLTLERRGKKVIGQTTLGTGILRFLGKTIAVFSKENLE
ncbi:MAG: hypothetical protein QF363_22335 [Planctomycetaceae bacterium]|nr:hypothetical protein [Planctomycetaceae bacterium]